MDQRDAQSNEEPMAGPSNQGFELIFDPSSHFISDGKYIFDTSEITAEQAAFVLGVLGVTHCLSGEEVSSPEKSISDLEEAMTRKIFLCEDDSELSVTDDSEAGVEDEDEDKKSEESDSESSSNDESDSEAEEKYRDMKVFFFKKRSETLPPKRNTISRTGPAPEVLNFLNQEGLLTAGITPHFDPNCGACCLGPQNIQKHLGSVPPHIRHSCEWGIISTSDLTECVKTEENGNILPNYFVPKKEVVAEDEEAGEEKATEDDKHTGSSTDDNAEEVPDPIQPRQVQPKKKRRKHPKRK